MVDVGVDTSALRHFVVRIRSVSGQTLGSGVIVAPGQVLTCAHVVRGVDDVLVQSPGFGSEREKLPWGKPATVTVRTPAPTGGGLWPFPDLAVLMVSSPHVLIPVAPLDVAVGDRRLPLLSGDGVIGWGFPRREEGIDPPGSPATFVLEGVEGDEFLTFKAGQAQPGLSGAPLVSPKTRNVVGLMSATRSTSTDLGGYASPVSAMKDSSLFFSSTGHDPEKVLGELIEGNRTLSLTNRTPWIKVIRAVGAEWLVDEPWAEFRRNPRSDPSDLLRADFGVVSYLFRQDELRKQRRGWCESADPFSILVVRGEGGSGKTRFAIQFCQVMQNRGWLAGWLPKTGDEIVTAPVPRLVVVDYVELADPEPMPLSLS